MATRKNISDMQALDRAADSRGLLDDRRLIELKNEKQLQEIKEVVLKREAERLAKKYGVNHPRVQQLQTRIRYNQDMFAALESEILKTQTTTEPLPNKAWRLVGKILDQKNQPLAEMTVVFANNEKVWLREFGSSISDKSGEFSLTISEKSIGQAEKIGIHLAVLVKGKELIYFDAAAQKPQPGIIDYQIVNLRG